MNMKNEESLILKKTHWYLMKTKGTSCLFPQSEEDITELRWIGPADFKIVLQNTYPTIVEVLRAGGYNLV